tara:strand:+ start:473 stop:691 length:219 start_codon:yes stop_codon:yes gene_type:complete
MISKKTASGANSTTWATKSNQANISWFWLRFNKRFQAACASPEERTNARGSHVIFGIIAGAGAVLLVEVFKG